MASSAAYSISHKARNQSVQIDYGEKKKEIILRHSEDEYARTTRKLDVRNIQSDKQSIKKDTKLNEFDFSANPKTEPSRPLPGKPLFSPENMLALLQNNDKNKINVATEDAVKDRKEVKVGLDVEILLSKKDVKDSQTEYVSERKSYKQDTLIRTENLRSEADVSNINIPLNKPTSAEEPNRPVITPQETVPGEVKSAAIPAIKGGNPDAKDSKENQNEHVAAPGINISQNKPTAGEEPLDLKITAEETSPRQVKSAAIPAIERGNSDAKITNKNQNEYVAAPGINISKAEPAALEEPLDLKVTTEDAAPRQVKSAAISGVDANESGNSVRIENKENQNEYVTDRNSIINVPSPGQENSRPEIAAPDINISLATPAADQDTNKLKIAREEVTDKKLKTITGSGAEVKENETPGKKEPIEKKDLNFSSEPSTPSLTKEVSGESGEKGSESSAVGSDSSEAGGETSEAGDVLGSGPQFKLDSFSI